MYLAGMWVRPARLPEEGVVTREARTEAGRRRERTKEGGKEGQ